MRTRYIRKLLSAALGLIVLGCLWFYFAPAPLGGSTTYVVTRGISMEPRFHTGDLALVRSRSSYHVGEIVAYHNEMLHTIVLHRIIGRAGSRYIFKGDNNNFTDPERPSASQLVGSLWLHIPGAGADLQSIRSPALIGLLVAVGVLLLTGAAFTRRRRLRRRQLRAEGSAHLPSPRPARRSAAPVAGVAAVGLLVALPFLALALVAFTTSPTTRDPYTVPYKQSGTFSYSAEGPSGPTYPSGEAVTGDPLFTHVLKAVDFSFAYHFHAVGRHSLAGVASLEAMVTSTTGWQTTLQLAPSTRFHGSHTLVTGTLDLASLLAVIHNVETTTKASGSYTLTLLPHVSAAGSVNALPLHTTFAPKVQFSLTPVEAQPVISGAAAFGSPAAERAAANQFNPSIASSARGSRSQPVSLSLGVAEISVAAARTLARDAIAIIVCALLVILACLRPILALVRSRPREESASIRARYGRMIVPVARVWQLPGVPVIDVADMEALAQIAEHYDRSILHETAEEGEAFWVTDESGQFRYAIGAWASSVEDEFAHEGSSNTLVHDVYVDELDLDGAISAHGTQPEEEEEEIFAGDAVTQGEWTPRRSGSGRAGKPRLA
jgi:signal peptidase I